MARPRTHAAEISWVVARALHGAVWDLRDRDASVRCEALHNPDQLGAQLGAGSRGPRCNQIVQDRMFIE
jgi:hypothetical protein